LILVFLATLGAVVVGFVLYPVFAEERAGALGASAEALALRDLEEKKARLYTAIKDLDFELDAGKVSSEDYESARRDYLAQATEVMEQIDSIAPEKTTSLATSSEDASAQKKAGARICSSCGEASSENAKFCIGCGRAFELNCSQCGENIPERAKFCSGCGHKIES
jgi:hypothetical protein